MANEWPEIGFLNYSSNTRTIIVFLYVVINIILFFSLRKKHINGKKFHKILSLINIILLLFILVICLYQIHVLFIIFAPFIIMFVVFLGYGSTKELTDEDKSIVINKNIRLQTSLHNLDFSFFPGYYVMESWKKYGN